MKKGRAGGPLNCIRKMKLKWGDHELYSKPEREGGWAHAFHSKTVMKPMGQPLHSKLDMKGRVGGPINFIRERNVNETI